LWRRSSQQVLNPSNTEGGRAQSLVVGSKSALRFSRYGTVLKLWSQRFWNKAWTNLSFSKIFNYSLFRCALTNVHLVR
jgi:hypothetical protein